MPKRFNATRRKWHRKAPRHRSNFRATNSKDASSVKKDATIHAFEEATGIDVIIDDTPGSIIISGFDLMRRYIAKISLERLIVDGRIHPARIEETVAKVKDEVNELIRELGERSRV